MKIISEIKGFVTNSSSANYWLEDGELVSGSGTNSSMNASKFQKELSSGFIYWLILSLILASVIYFKKIGFIKFDWNKIKNRQVIAHLLIILFVLIYQILNYMLTNRGAAGIFVNNDRSLINFFISIISLSVLVNSFCFIFRLFTPSFDRKKIQKYLVILGLLTIVLISFVFYMDANNKYRKALDLYANEYFKDLPRPSVESIMVERFVMQERDDILLYYNYLFDSAYNKMWYLNHIIIISIYFYILSFKNSKNYGKKSSQKL